jgi:ABC-type transport system involved in multi-copper enzyme maturation permease subunit
MNSYLPYIILSYGEMPPLQAYYYESGNLTLFLIIVLAVSFFFGGIICSEFRNKTGMVIIPLSNRFKLLIGKYFANNIFVIGIAAVHYLTIALYGYHFYGSPILKTLAYSFCFLILFILALGSIATFLSSFMPSKIPVIFILIGYVIILEPILTYFIMDLNIEIEPLYSLSYLFNITNYVLYPNFSTLPRRDALGSWMYPSIEGALIFLLVYTVIFFIFGFLLFKRREF